jgi:hypothetical protein
VKCSPDRTSQAAAGNGIFVVGDRRPKTCLRDEASAADKDRELSGLHARRWGAGPDPNCNLRGAYHAWTVPDLTIARFYPDLVSTKKCPLILLKLKRPALLIDGEAKPFDPAAFGACVAAAPGYSMGFDAAVRA